MSQVPTFHAFGIGQASFSRAGTMLDCYFPAPRLTADAPAQAWLAQQAGATSVDPAAVRALAGDCDDTALRASLTSLMELDRPLVLCHLPEDRPIDGTAQAYLKLHLLSHRQALPNSLNLDGIFAHLPNVVWTAAGPVATEDFEARQVAARNDGAPLDVLAVDKFPKMTNYVIPAGVRIADSARVRLGAYLGEGTTVMHEGFINFNAGAIGPNMVEGRLSQGVTMGAHSDLGGGSSTMGTLSGGGELRISIGEQCLIGANAGTGIPLGDRCTIEAGLYITAGTPVLLIDGEHPDGRPVKARELAGISDLLFLRNGRTGTVECRSNQRAIELNSTLHAHN
ncbi:MAG: DapH/DapD/GlmU-related protein [Pseudomonadota bacterium]